MSFEDLAVGRPPRREIARVRFWTGGRAPLVQLTAFQSKENLMSPTATKTTLSATATLPRRALPKMDLGSQIPPGLELFPPFDELIPRRNDLLRAARHARSAHSDAEKAIEAAAARDAEAFRDAAVSGAKDPGRVNELAAAAVAEVAYTEALGMTKAANEAIAAVRAAVLGEAGVSALDAIEERLNTAHDRLSGHLDEVAGDMAEIAALIAIGEGVAVQQRRHVRRGNLIQQRTPEVDERWRDRSGYPIVQGHPVPPSTLVDVLRGYGAPSS